MTCQARRQISSLRLTKAHPNNINIRRIAGFRSVYTSYDIMTITIATPFVLSDFITIVSRKAKKKQATCNERVSYLHTGSTAVNFVKVAVY